MVEKRFTRQIEEDVKGSLISESFRAAIREQKLHTVGSPRIENVEFGRGQPLRYTAIIETIPEFPLPDYKNLAVTARESTVSEEEIDKALQQLQEQRAEFDDIKDRPLAMDDFAVIHFEGFSNGKPIAEMGPRAKTIGNGKNFWLMMNSSSFLPGFCDQLVGARRGEKKQVLADFPADFPLSELRGAKATYFVDLVGIKQKKLPPPDEKFAQSFQIPTLAELRQRLREDLLRAHQERIRSEQYNQLLSALLSRINVDLPPSLVNAETRQGIYDTVRTLQMRGVSPESIEQEKEKIFGSAAHSAADRVKARIVLSRIAEAEKIEVTRKEMDAKIAQLAASHQAPAGQLRAELEERGALGSIAEEIVMDKVLDFLLQHARVEAGTQ